MSIHCSLCSQNTRRCECHVGYVGDGLQCLAELEPPVDRCMSKSAPCHRDALCTDLHFQGMLPYPPPTHCIIPGYCPVNHTPSLLPAEKRAGVFHIQATSGSYGLTFSEAKEACEDQGAVLASLPQLSAAQQVHRAQGKELSLWTPIELGFGLSISPLAPTAGFSCLLHGLVGQWLCCPPCRLPSGRLW